LTLSGTLRTIRFKDVPIFSCSGGFNFLTCWKVLRRRPAIVALMGASSTTVVVTQLMPLSVQTILLLLAIDKKSARDHVGWVMSKLGRFFSTSIIAKTSSFVPLATTRRKLP